MTKKPQIHKSKEEIIDQMKKNEAFMKKMKFVKEEFYPALCEAATSIEDAGILLTGFNNTIMQSFLALMKEKKLSEFDLVSKLDPTSEKIAENKKLLALFADLSVFDAKDYIEGMKGEISLFQQEEMRNRPLSSLKTKWADEK